MTNIREIVLSKLVPSERNVRRTGRDAGVQELARSIAAHGLLQSLSVRPVLDARERETGKFEVIGGGRRLAALNLLVARKTLKKSAVVPCVVAGDGDAEELSLAENIMREQLHPADQYEAFARLHTENNLGAEEIAARFGVTAAVVRQRLRLGAASPKLIALYREGELDLDQLMAFCLTDDHARQEQVYEALLHNRSPHAIRRTLTEAHVDAEDRRARFVGAEAYEAAGGCIVRDLFDEEHGGYFADPTLLDRLVAEKLEQAAGEVRSEGWKWVEASVDFPHSHGFRRVHVSQRKLSARERKALAKAEADSEKIAIEYESVSELPEDVAAELERLQAQIDATYSFDPEDIARGGAFVSLGHDGELRVERGFIRPQDEAPRGTASQGGTSDDEAASQVGGLSEKLIADLTAHRTAALRDMIAQSPEIALIAAVHALTGQTFYRGFFGSCLRLQAQSTSLERHASLDQTTAAKSIGARHELWAQRLPENESELWSFLTSLDRAELMVLFAHCVSLTVDAVRLPKGNANEALAHADQLADAVKLDMGAYWTATAASYFGRVTKPLILEAVSEGKSADAAKSIADMKKPAMAESAERLLADRKWLPDVLRARQADEALTM